MKQETINVASEIGEILLENAKLKAMPTEELKNFSKFLFQAIKLWGEKNILWGMTTDERKELLGHLIDDTLIEYKTLQQ